jgi:hypothetical protein
MQTPRYSRRSFAYSHAPAARRLHCLWSAWMAYLAPIRVAARALLFRISLKKIEMEQDVLSATNGWWLPLITWIWILLWGRPCAVFSTPRRIYSIRERQDGFCVCPMVPLHMCTPVSDQRPNSFLGDLCKSVITHALELIYEVVSTIDLPRKSTCSPSILAPCLAYRQLREEQELQL